MPRRCNSPATLTDCPARCKKSAALTEGSHIESAHAAEASHMFFGSPLKSSFFNIFATHPPLAERIRAIDPNWDGTFPPLTVAPLDDASPSRVTHARSAFPPIIPGFPLGAAGFAAAATTIPTASVLPSLGNPTLQHLHYAVELRNSLPENIRAAARQPQGACALLFALLLSENESLRASQLRELATRTDATIHALTATLWPEVSVISRRARLPLVNLSLPALKQISAAQFLQLQDALTWLIESDKRIVLFEFVLQKIIQHQVEPHFTAARPANIQFYAMQPLVADCVLLLSALAYTGQTSPADVAKAFQAGVPYLRLADISPTVLPVNQCGLANINRSLDRLVLAAPQIKKIVLEACTQVVGADGVIQENEAELLRGIAETLDCPMPPFLAAE